MFGACQKALDLGLQFSCDFEGECFASHVACQDVVELTVPKQRCDPVEVALQKCLRSRREITRQVQVGDDVAVHNNHCRPSRLKPSIS